MTKNTQDLTGLIVGPLKILEPTDKRDSSKRVIWKAECVCGKFEYGSRLQLEKYAGHSTCPGHPFKGKAKAIVGFRLHPSRRGEPVNISALEVWQATRHPETSDDKNNRLISIDGSKILRERLGLSGYKTETIILKNSVQVLGRKAEKVLFAKSLGSDDRVLLHLQLVDTNGKQSIVSSRKEFPNAEWEMVSAMLAEMEVSWREREPRRKMRCCK
jgi:hypothetical protein